jgi:hypothetical protein
MKQSTRSLAAWLTLFAVAFAQVAMAPHVYAFGLRGVLPSPTHAAVRSPASLDDHCAGHTKRPGVSSTNLCETHCSNSAPPGAPPGLLKVASPALTVGMSGSPVASVGSALDRRQQIVLQRAPPFILQFCRLLI